MSGSVVPQWPGWTNGLVRMYSCLLTLIVINSSKVEQSIMGVERILLSGDDQIIDIVFLSLIKAETGDQRDKLKIDIRLHWETFRDIEGGLH